MDRKMLILALILTLLLFLALICLVGCNARHCIGIDGAYQDYSGSIEYCFNLEKSKNLGVLVFDSDLGPIYGLDKKFLEEIADELEDPEMKAVSKTHPLYRIKNILGEEHAKKD